MQKRKCAVVGAFVVGLAFCAAMAARGDVTFYWGTPSVLKTGTMPDIVDRNGVAIPITADWTVGIYLVSDNTPVFLSTGAGSAEGEKWWALASAGAYYNSFDARTKLQGFSGLNIYTRIWDPTLPGWYADTGLTNITWTAANETDGTVFTDIYYTFGPVVRGDWRMVPEPTVMALFGLGLVTLAARRARNKRA